MGIFDIIELQQHVNAIGEYVFYYSDVLSNKDGYPKELDSIAGYMRDHLKKMSDVLAKMK